MRSLIDEPALAGQLSENGRQEVIRRFSLNTMVDQIRSVYLDCLGENAAPGALASVASRNL
jgi:glycosyltransferase involved in cell wall biosynthesis